MELTNPRLDRGLFRTELLELRARVSRKEHTSVASFSNDVLRVIDSQFGNSAATLSELISLVSGRAEDMKQEDRDRRTLARRIVKAIVPLIEDAARKEAELTGRPYAQQIREMDEALLSRRESVAESVETRVFESVETKQEIDIASPGDGDGDGDVVMNDVPTAILDKSLQLELDGDTQQIPEKADIKPEGLRLEGELVTFDTPPASTNGFKHEQQVNGDSVPNQVQQVEPPTPPMSLEGHPQSSPSEGGIPWYVAPFDPDGLTICEERWTGPEVLRELSEELSEMDEDELLELGPGDDLAEDLDGASLEKGLDPASALANSVAKKKVSKRVSKRTRNAEWLGTRSFRVRR